MLIKAQVSVQITDANLGHRSFREGVISDRNQGVRQGRLGDGSWPTVRAEPAAYRISSAGPRLRARAPGRWTTYRGPSSSSGDRPVPPKHRHESSAFPPARI